MREAGRTSAFKSYMNVNVQNTSTISILVLYHWYNIPFCAFIIIPYALSYNVVFIYTCAVYYNDYVRNMCIYV